MPTSSRLPSRLQRVLSHGFELAVTGGWLLVGLAYLTDRNFTAIHSQIGHDLGWWQWIWSTWYIIGGMMNWYGVIDRKINWRVAGLIITCSGLIVQFGAALTAQIGFRTFTYGLYATFCALKLYMMRGVYFQDKTYEL